jgi:hypothetical protein
VPFHHFRHAAGVTHAAWRFLAASPRLRARLRDRDALALLLAALCHDVGHAGRTNAFHVNSGSRLARTYNDASCNENLHATLACDLLDASGVLAGLTPPEAREFRAALIGAILATDMARHTELLARTTTWVAAQAAAAGAGAGAAASLRRSVEMRRSDDSRAADCPLVPFLLHCADLHTPLLPLARSRDVADALAREFAGQAAAERAAGLPVTVMEAHTPHAQAKAECGFLDYVIRPVYATLVSLEPELRECLARVDASRAMWAARAAAGGGGGGSGAH